MLSLAESEVFDIQMCPDEKGRVVIGSLTALHKGSGGNDKLPPRSFSTIGIVQEFCQASTQPPPQTSSPWCSVCPPYGINSMNHPYPTRGRSFEGTGRGRLGGVLYKSLK